MTHIDKNYAPIIIGDYINHQEIHIDKQLNITNGRPAGAETDGGKETDGGREARGETERAEKSPVAHMGKRVERVFRTAEERGLLSRAGDGYVWHENDTLLDYFLGRTLCGDYPFGDDKPCWRFAKEKRNMPAKEMNRLFGRDRIGEIRRRRNMLPVPQGHERIDEIVDGNP